MASAVCHFSTGVLFWFLFFVGKTKLSLCILYCGKEYTPHLGPESISKVGDRIFIYVIVWPHPWHVEVPGNAQVEILELENTVAKIKSHWVGSIAE